jgi:anti-anti-sigma regulatory factor
MDFMDSKMGQVKLSIEEKTARLVFPADFKISGAKAFMATVARVMRKKPEALVLDAAALERVDGATLQATVVAWRAMKNAGISVRWENCPASMVDGARLLGLASAAGIDP